MNATAVLISGKGTNLQALINYEQEHDSAYNLQLVLSNNPAAGGLQLAEQAGIETLVVDHKAYVNRTAYDQALDAVLSERGIQWIALAGFMRLLSPGFVQKWSGKMINIHPSLLPAFAGLHTHQAALEYGVRYSGCSVIFVDDGVDTGAIIEQAVVPVLEQDTAASLGKRVLKEEHRIFPQALDDVAVGRVSLVSGKVIRQPASAHNPFH